MIRTALPSFIVIGAVKAATTWIAYQLQQHPRVFLPGPEPHFFSTEFHRGLDWYETWFEDADPDQVVGEKSADYLAHPDAPRRIAQMLPEAKLIVQLRNPVERAYSDYCMLFRRGTVRADPGHYLRRPDGDMPRFLNDGLYCRHLARYLDFFPREQIKVILYEDIKQTPERVVEQVSAHIGIEPRMAPGAIAARVNDSEAPLLPLALRKLLQPVKHMAEPLRDRPWFMAVRGRLARQVQYPPLTDDLRLRLRDYYAKDVDALQQLLGRDLTSWLTVEERADQRA